MRYLFLVFVAIVLLAPTACDTSGPAEGTGAVAEVRYRTPLVDGASGAIRGPDGAIIATGQTDGRIGQGDWTNGFPLLLRVRPGGSIADTTVYRDVRYGSALDAVVLDNGLAVLVEEQNYDQTGVEPTALALYRTDPDGTRRDTLFRPDSMFAARDPLHRTDDGGFLLALGRTDEDDADLIKLGRSGQVEWTYRMPDVQFTSAVAEAGGGDLFVSGTRSARQFDLVRLGPDGAPKWRRTYGTDSTGAPFRDVRSIVADGDGAIVFGTREPTDDDNPRTQSVTLTWFDRTGRVVKEKSYATGPVEASALTALPGGRLALSYAENYGAPGDPGKTRAFLLSLDPEGTVQQRWRVGPRTGTTRITSLIPLPNGRIAAVGSTGPEAIGGYGGDDFDVLTAIYQTK